MKRTVLFSLFAIFFAFVLPPLLSVPGGSAQAAEPAPSAPLPTAAEAAAPSAAPVLDSAIPLTLQTEEGVLEMHMSDYLPLALAGEMPASFEPEALKAQAVALRSYALYHQASRKAAHPEADVCGSAACCAARASLSALQETWGEAFDAYYAKICAAVRETDGQYLVWEDAPALAVFHAASAGQTEDGAELGVEKSYLVSVDTPESADTVRNLCTTVEVTPEEFRTAVLSLCPEAALSDSPERWVGQTALNHAGRVDTVEIGGSLLSGLALRQLFSLRSTDFTLAWDGAGFCFRVRGYGHGVGMSQYGANLLARAGADYAEILNHYYPGAALVLAMRQS